MYFRGVAELGIRYSNVHVTCWIRAIGCPVRDFERAGQLRYFSLLLSVRHIVQ